LDVALLPAIDLFNPQESADELPPLLPGQSAAGDSSSRVLAPYLIDEIQITPRFRFLVGARYDDIDFEDEISQTSRRDGKLSPLLGTVFQPLDSLHLYANVAQSFAPPSPRVTGDRQPEESQQVELGARQSLLDGRMRLTAAIYQIERENIAIPDDNGFTQQVGDQRARGFELELAAELPRGFHGLLAYGYTDSELTRFSETVFVPVFPPQFVVLDRSGNKSAFAPDHLASLWLSKNLGHGITLAGGLRYVGEQFIAEDNATRLDDYWLVNLAAIYQIRQWRLSLHLNNLTDQDYETRGFGTSSVIPGQPFSALLGLDYRF
jgi:catecholate siderophore receptor